MKNLQDLYDEYMATRPSQGKLKSASSMLIHVCKALEISSQEEVTADYFEAIPDALNSYYFSHPIKATMDKTILAEMIGRVGPKKKVRKLLEKLLDDKEENVQQYALNSLEYYGLDHPEVVLPYIERYRSSENETMLTTAAMLTGSLLCSDRSNYVLHRIKIWYDAGDISFVEQAIKRVILLLNKGKCDEKYMTPEQLKKWTSENCADIATAIFA
jgi:hypothetical protein